MATEPTGNAATDAEFEDQTMPWIVGDFEFADKTWLVVLWPPDHGSRWEVYAADLPWYWLKQPHEDRRV